ncbi:MAG: hypothetical protein JWQ95_1054 [Sphaerisporangium sp.]|jgi:hypothetical protein|nr:hypothetical protein [Sphaerisporangium sp.]
MRERLEGILARTERARAWGDAALPLRPLINRDGYVPIKTRLSVDDLDLLVGARKELLCFSELGLRLLDLHQPRDAGGITSDAAHPILRCRSCMWRWPCPTFRAMSEALEALPVYEPGGTSAGMPEPIAANDLAEMPHSFGTDIRESASTNGVLDTNVTFRTNGIDTSLDLSGYRLGGSHEKSPADGTTPEPRSGRRAGDRKPDLEAAARAFVDDGDGAFMSFDDAARDREPEARAPIGARGPRGLSLKGHLEDPW